MRRVRWYIDVEVCCADDIADSRSHLKLEAKSFKLDAQVLIKACRKRVIGDVQQRAYRALCIGSGSSCLTKRCTLRCG